MYLSTSVDPVPGSFRVALQLVHTSVEFVQGGLAYGYTVIAVVIGIGGMSGMGTWKPGGGWKASGNSMMLR